MSNTADMSTPVTRGELREELDKLATKAGLDALREETRQVVTASEQRLRELIKSNERELRELIKVNHKELQADLALHAGALFESMSALIRAHDDKYKDLPARVTQLEAKVSRRKAR